MTNDVLFEQQGALGLITLNRPQALNALSLPMIEAIMPQLKIWAASPSIKAVAITGAGEKAFCAGGDVRAAYEAGKAKQPLTQHFFMQEYILNRTIARYSKPFIALVHGICMGGGMGLSQHGSHIIVAERALLAMPECAIGLFPDVGGTVFLNRCPGQLGLYLALTGARLSAADALYARLATHYVPHHYWPDYLARLAAGDEPSLALAALAQDAGSSLLAQHQAEIDEIFSAADVSAIMAALAQSNNEWAKTALASMQAASPTSLTLTLKQLREGRGLNIESALFYEFRLSQACMRGHDFYEGIRAQLVDKDKNPRWQPATLAEVKPDSIERMFEQDTLLDIMFPAQF